MSTNRQQRQPAGVPSGGQFAPSAHPRPAYELGPEALVKLDLDDTLARAQEALSGRRNAAGRLNTADDLASEMYCARRKLEDHWRATGQWHEYPDGRVTVTRAANGDSLTWRQPGGRLTRKAHAISAKVAARPLLRFSTQAATEARQAAGRELAADGKPTSPNAIAAVRMLSIGSLDSSPVDPAATGDDGLSRVDDWDRIERAVERVPSDQRDEARRVVAAARAMGGELNIAAIARETGIPEETVRRRVKTLREKLGDSRAG